MKKIIKDAYSSICVSKELEEKIMNRTVNKKYMKRVPKYVVVGISIFVLCISATIVVYADEIKEIIKSWHPAIELEDGTKIPIAEGGMLKDIPDTAPKIEIKPDGKNFLLRMTVEEVENILGFPILKLKDAPSKEITYLTSLDKNGTIGSLHLFGHIFAESERRYISTSMVMLNKNADSQFLESYKDGDEIDAAGEKVLLEQYFSNNLGVEVILYSYQGSKNITATFNYDNILYILNSGGFSEQEIKDIIEQLSF